MAAGVSPSLEPPPGGSVGPAGVLILGVPDPGGYGLESPRGRDQTVQRTPGTQGRWPEWSSGSSKTRDKVIIITGLIGIIERCLAGLLDVWKERPLSLPQWSLCHPDPFSPPASRR